VFGSFLLLRYYPGCSSINLLTPSAGLRPVTTLHFCAWASALQSLLPLLRISQTNPWKEKLVLVSVESVLQPNRRTFDPPFHAAAAQQMKKRTSFQSNNLLTPSTGVNPNATLHFALGFDPGVFAATPGTHSDEHMGVNAPVSGMAVSAPAISAENACVPLPMHERKSPPPKKPSPVHVLLYR
jgi:hypothetical protein